MTAINDVVDLTREGEIAVITLDSPPVNALSAQLRAGIAQAIPRPSTRSPPSCAPGSRRPSSRPSQMMRRRRSF